MMASETIFNTVRLGNRFGKIAAGYEADLVVMNRDLQIQTTIVNGKIVYKM